MSIKELKEIQRSYREKIYSAANAIDPKLLGILLFDDLFNDHYMDNRLHNLFYDNVRPIYIQYQAEFQQKTQAYLLDYISDMSLILPCTGYLSSTGEETDSFSYHIPSDYIPSVEIEPVYEAVDNLIYDLTIRPFWAQNQYTLFGNNESVIIDSYSTPEEFIKNNRLKFNRTFNESNLAKMERAVHIKESLGYPIYVPTITKFEDDRIPGVYETAVRRHAILKKVMETEELLNCETPMYSKVTPECTVTIKDNLYGDFI